MTQVMIELAGSGVCRLELPNMDTNYQLASRYNRLLAALWDGLYVAGPALLGLALSMPFIGSTRHVESAMIPYYIGVVLTMVVGLYNLVLFCRTGQTMGKRRQGLQVVSLSGEPMSGGGLFWRSICPSVIGMVPLLGIVAFFDVFFIFGQSRRCLHDYLASSVVADKDSIRQQEFGVGLNPISDDIGFTRF